jgi:phospholipid/cholesterol/gamma-HCH transport system substrate-binding protein
MKQSSSFEVILGALVILVAVGFLGFAYSSTGGALPSDYELSARMTHADGLAAGASDVRISGVKVGAVTDVALEPKSHLALVHWRVRSDIRLPVDSSLSVASDTLSSHAYLMIAPGNATATLAPGAMLARTQ